MRPPKEVRLMLQGLLPGILPLAVEWAELQVEEGMCNGRPLEADEVQIAESVGVQCAEKVRISVVEQLPVPDAPQLRLAADLVGLLGPGAIGITFSSVVYIKTGHESSRLIAHECRHVHQYEQYGSVKDFLSVYLKELVMYGYQNAPLERDARAYEQLVHPEF